MLNFLSLLISLPTKKRDNKSKKMEFAPKALNSRKFWRGFFLLRTEMCWSDIRNLFENVQNITTISTKDFGGNDGDEENSKQAIEFPSHSDGRKGGKRKSIFMSF